MSFIQEYRRVASNQDHPAIYIDNQTNGSNSKQNHRIRRAVQPQLDALRGERPTGSRLLTSNSCSGSSEPDFSSARYSIASQKAGSFKIVQGPLGYYFVMKKEDRYTSSSSAFFYSAPFSSRYRAEQEAQKKCSELPRRSRL